MYDFVKSVLDHVHFQSPVISYSRSSIVKTMSTASSIELPGQSFILKTIERFLESAPSNDTTNTDTNNGMEGEWKIS